VRTRAAYCAAVLLLTVDPVPADTARAGDAGAHLRGLSDASRQLIDRAVVSSPTVAGLAAALNASDVVVLVDVTLRADGIAAGLQLLTTTGGTRLLGIRLDRRRSPWEQIEWLGHELQHAVEVAASSARTPEEFEALFRRIGRRSGAPGRFETDAAVQVSRRVREELLSARW